MRAWLFAGLGTGRDGSGGVRRREQWWWRAVAVAGERTRPLSLLLPSFNPYLFFVFSFSPCWLVSSICAPFFDADCFPQCKQAMATEVTFVLPSAAPKAASSSPGGAVGDETGG